VKVVVDLGCVERNGADSLAVLAREYEPDFIYGFDPSPLLNEEMPTINGVPCTLRRRAAWVEDGRCGFHESGSGSRIGPGDDVECFDFSAWLRELKETADEVVVKMDIEGVEKALVTQLIDQRTDLLIDELLIEWHDPAWRAELEGLLSCPLRQWWL